MNKNLLILGAGQYGTIAEETARGMKQFDKIDFLDDSNMAAIGRFEDYENFAAQYSYAFVALGDPELRLKWLCRLEEAAFYAAVLVSDRAFISQSAQIDKGCIIEPMAVIHAGTVLSRGVIVSAGAIISHNSFVGDGCHLECGAVVMPNTILPPKTKLKCNGVYKRDDTAEFLRRCSEDY